MNTPWTTTAAAYAADLYHKGHSISDIATALTRTERSVIAKLTQLGLYKAAPKPTREPTKAELVGELCNRLELDPTVMYTLTAASHVALVMLLSAIVD